MTAADVVLVLGAGAVAAYVAYAVGYARGFGAATESAVAGLAAMRRR